MKICSVAKYFSVVARLSPPAFHPPLPHHHRTTTTTTSTSSSCPSSSYGLFLPRNARVNFIRRVFIHGCIQIFSARGTCVCMCVRACVTRMRVAELVSGIRGIGGKINNCRKGFIGLSSTRGVPSAPRENAPVSLFLPHLPRSLFYLSLSLSPRFSIISLPRAERR